MPNAKTVVQTNSTYQSIKEIPLKVVTFAELWDAFPWGNPCSGPYHDQCAARIGVALRGASVEGKSFRGARCHIDHPSHMLRAAEVADWLKRRPFAGCPKEKEVTGKDWQDKVKGQTGIIFFHNYWHRDTDGPGVFTGNHIDLWNGSRLTASGIGDSLVTAGRYVGIRSIKISLESVNIPFHRDIYSDLGESSIILFWNIK